MKNKLRIIVFFFVIYLCSYFFYGKNSLGLQIIKNTSFIKTQDSIQIQIFDLEDFHRNQLKLSKILKKRGFKNVEINYAENFLDEKGYIYWLDLEKLTPFVTFSYNGLFKKNEISEEYESIYVWFFYKWIKAYKSKNRAMY